MIYCTPTVIKPCPEDKTITSTFIKTATLTFITTSTSTSTFTLVIPTCEARNSPCTIDNFSSCCSKCCRFPNSNPQEEFCCQCFDPLLPMMFNVITFLFLHFYQTYFFFKDIHIDLYFTITIPPMTVFTGGILYERQIRTRSKNVALGSQQYFIIFSCRCRVLNS